MRRIVNNHNHTNVRSGGDGYEGHIVHFEAIRKPYNNVYQMIEISQCHVGAVREPPKCNESSKMSVIWVNARPVHRRRLQASLYKKDAPARRLFHHGTHRRDGRAANAPDPVPTSSTMSFGLTNLQHLQPQLADIATACRLYHSLLYVFLSKIP